MLEFPTITALTLGATIILQMGMGMYTSGGRFKYAQSIGGGGKPGMTARMRAHGNLTENAPIILLTLGLLEASGANRTGIITLAAVFFAGRLLHPIGMGIKKVPNAPRFLGAFTSYMVGFVSGGWLLLTAAQML